MRVVRLPVTVVPLSNQRIGNRIQPPRSLTPASLIEITWVLLQERRQYGSSDIRACNNVRVGSAVALSITLCALSISAEIVLRLLNSRNRSGHSEADRVHGSFPRKLALLLRAQRHCVAVVADIPIGNDAEHPLLLLRLDLIFRQCDPSGAEP